MHRFLFTVFLAVLLAARLRATEPPPDPNSPESELAALHILDGYELSLFASEADGIAKPIQMRWDQRGRLWVACTTTYPQVEPGKKPNDRIVILEDTTGSGRADKSTVFADGLHIPTGIELGLDGCYVGAATELLYLRDTTGSGHADQREVLFSGFGTGDAHQMINSFQWGPGGEIWIGQGAHSFSNVETPWGVERLWSAGIWRLRPRSQRLDPFLDSREGHATNTWPGPANPWGFAFDDWGQIFNNDGAGNRGISWIVPGMIRSTRNVPIPSLWKIPKGCGMDIIGSAHFPPEMQGRLVLGHYFTASVRQFQIRDDASGFALTELPMLIKSDTNAFRIVDVKVGPDGALYLLDWYNPVIGHYQASYRDPNRDKTHGRIWRLTAKGRPLLTKPDLASLAPAQLMDQLRSPDRWTTYQARRLLFNLPSEQVVPAADAWVAKLNPASPTYEHELFSAIGIFESHEAVRPELLKKLIAAKDFRARAYAARVVGHWADRLDRPLDLLAALVQDEHPRVRVEAIVSTTFVNDPRGIEVAAMAADRPLDQWINHAMLRAVDATKDLWRPAFARGELTFANRVNRLSWVIQADGTPAVAAPLRAMLSHVDAKTRSDLATLLAGVGTPDDLQLLLTHDGQDSRVLRELAAAWRVRQAKPSGDVAAPLSALLEHGDAGVRIAAIGLAGAWSFTGAAPRLRAIATSPSEPPPMRGAAIAALGEMRAATAAELAPLLAPHQPSPVRLAAVTALASTNLGAAATAATGILADVDHTDPDTTADVMAIFLQRKGGPAALAKAITAAKLPVKPAQRCLDLLHARGRDDPALRAALNRAIGVTDDTPPYSEPYVRDLAADAAAHGDPARGKRVYDTKLAGVCAACHAIDGKGGNLGPDLSAIGRGLTPEFIVESILWPKRSVKEGYLSVSLSTKDGGEFTGYVVAETASEIQIRDVASNTVQRIAKSAITRRTEAGTIMPDGLTAPLSREELRDLISYLTHLGKADAKR